MKCVILAGGLGSRISEETHLKPKPMVQIGGRPILWHIMKIYSAYGVQDFIICVGYRGYVIKEYFANYFLHMSDVTFDMEKNNMQVHQRKAEPWKVTIIDTGETSMTGGRLKKVGKYWTRARSVSLTGTAWPRRHSRSDQGPHGRRRLVTLMAVRAPGRYGALSLEADNVTSFLEKPEGDGGWINGGILCRPAQGPGGDRWRPIELGSPCAAAIGGSFSARRVFSSWILAAHGHPQREKSSGGTLVVRRRTLENLVGLFVRIEIFCFTSDPVVIFASVVMGTVHILKGCGLLTFWLGHHSEVIARAVISRDGWSKQIDISKPGSCEIAYCQSRG